LNYYHLTPKIFGGHVTLATPQILLSSQQSTTVKDMNIFYGTVLYCRLLLKHTHVTLVDNCNQLYCFIIQPPHLS